MKLPIQAAPVIRQAGFLPSSDSSWAGLRVAGQRPVGKTCVDKNCTSNSQCPTGTPYCCTNHTECCDEAC